MPRIRKSLCAGLSLALLLSAALSARGVPPLGRSTVPQALIDPHLIRLRVIDGDAIRFSQLPANAGLSQSRVTQIVQDGQGFLWFATQHGVDRYDGYEFKAFKNEPGHPGSLCGVFVNSLFTDRTGNLWVGCEQGVDRFDPATETFVHYHIASAPVSHLSDAVRHIYEDPGGKLWLATGRGLARLDPRSRRTIWFHHDPSDPLSLSSDDVKFCEEDRHGVMWVATGEGIDEFDPKTGHVTFHVPLREPRELSFYEDREGIFWILSASGNGLAALDRKRGRLTRYSFAATDLAGLALTGVIQMLEDREGNLWVGTVSDGLFLFDRKHGQLIRYRHDPSNPDSIPENRVTTLFEDREGSIWVGLGATQPTFFTPGSPAFNKLPFDSRDPANLGEKLVNAIFQDRKGVLWIGTTGALDRCDSTGTRCTRYAIPGHGIASDVLSIIEDRSGALWVGTSGQGLCRFNEETGDCRMFRHSAGDPASISSNTVDRLLIDREGVLWVATADGLDRFAPETQSFIIYRDQSSLDSAAQMISMVEDRKGNLWLASLGSGLLRFDRKAARLGPFGGRPAAGGPGAAFGDISTEYVTAVHIDRKHRLWAGTFNGLDRIDPQTGAATRYSEANGLASTGISCILEDAGGDLWLSTTQGISKFDPDTGTFQNFSVADGLPGDLTAYSACFETTTGEMYFGGFTGATRFRPQEVTRDSYAPPVVLTSFDLFGAPVRIGPGSPLQRVIGFSRQVTLAHNQNSFSFQFAALSFRSPATNRYRYELEGLDRGWHEVGSDRRYAAYTTLPPGAYRFRLQGATNRGPWSTPGVTVRILIAPAWWATWWARALFALATLLAILALYFMRVRQLQRRFETQLEARESERTRVARELHDTLLQSFQGLLLRFQVAYELLPGRPAEARQDLGSAIERTVHAINEGRDAVQGLRASAVEGDDLVGAIKTLAEELAGDRCGEDVALRVDVQGTSQPLRAIVRDEIQQIAGEALRNSRRHAHASEIEVEVRYDKRQLRLRVRDNGGGIDARFLSGDGAAGHYGLHGMRERAQLVGGKLTVWTAAASGTEIEVTVPAARAYAAGSSGRFAWLARKLPRWLSGAAHE
jgi:ligand-binding sensor domain-containing protein/signal transduction histidine kinase